LHQNGAVGDQKVPLGNVFGEFGLNVNDQKCAVGGSKSGNWHWISFGPCAGAVDGGGVNAVPTCVSVKRSHFQCWLMRKRGGKLFADWRSHAGDPSISLFSASAGESFGVKRACNIYFGKERVGA